MATSPPAAGEPGADGATSAFPHRRDRTPAFAKARVRCSLEAPIRLAAGAATPGGDTMERQTRRTFLQTTACAVSTLATGPWVRRAHAQGAPVKIGLVLPYTGVYAELGNSITQAMELVFARENWTVAGRKIEMIKEDDEMKPPVGVRKTEKLIDSDKVDILTGPVHSGILMGMRDKVHSSKTILIVSNAGADAISRERCSKWIFRTSFSNWQPCQPMGGWVAKNVSKEVFQIAPNYQAGKDDMVAFRETFLPAGGKVIDEEYPKLGETDYAPYLTKIKQSGAKAVFAFFSGTDAVNFVKQYDQFGLKQNIKLTGPGFLTEPDVLPAQGGSALGIITGHFYTPLLDNPVNHRFVKDFRDKFYGKMPDGFACQGYDTAEVIVRALKAVNGNTQDKEKLVAAIAQVEFDSPRGRFRFDPKTHNVIQPFIYIREVREVYGGLSNVPIDKVADVRDPGTGCTLPA
jgi:branched-chain amino acid transport system substrate-binding protein